jgi:hypothetical protein
LGFNVRANPVDDAAAPVLRQFGADVALVLAEAVAQEAFARGLLVPHGHTEILHLELIANVTEVHGWTPWIAAEAVMGLLDSSESNLCEQCLDSLQLNRGTPLPTDGALACPGFESGRFATIVHRLNYQP